MASDYYGDIIANLEDGEVSDEKSLDDLHLGNAINLDEIYHYFKIDRSYPVLIRPSLRKELDSLVQTLPKSYSKQIGLLIPTLNLTCTSSEFVLLESNVANKLKDIISRALSLRSIKILINTINLAESSTPTIRESWWTAFNTILKGVCAHSEQKRGGKVAEVFNDVVSEGKFVKFDIRMKEIEYTTYIGSFVVALLNKANRTIYYGTFDSILLLLDTLGQRICLYISNSVSNNYMVPGSNNYIYLDEILEIFDSILKELGNDGYDIISLYEAFCVSSLLRSASDPINNCEDFYNSCMEELNEMLEGRESRDQILKKIYRFNQILHICNFHEVSNIFCLYRIWGHPIVNVYQGMEKVHKLGTEIKFIPLWIQNVCVYQFRKMFLCSYHKRHGKYPPVILSRSCYITQSIEQGVSIDPTNEQYDLYQFEHVELGQTWGIPDTYDLCHILNDKAVSPTRSELIKSIKDGNGTRCGLKRRGIIRWMEGTSMRCKNLLDNIERSGLSKNDLIIGMYEKEREIKIKARMFSLMSEEMRYYFVLTEELIANHILPYFPEITMKDSLNILLRKLWVHSKRLNEDCLDVNINIDFSKWNLNMRGDLTNGVFKEIDSLFGYTNVISRTHEIFEKSFIYSASGKYCPIINTDGELAEDAPMAYTGHFGGFEGLRQKGWTVVTVLILTYIADELKSKISLMGQGDNQVVKLHMPNRKWEAYNLPRQDRIDDAKYLRNTFIERMNMCFTSAKLPIKLRETWMSCRLFMYGKMMVLDNQLLAQWYKKVLRSYALSNEGTLTVGGVIGTIATNMSSAAAVSEAPDIMYYIYLILGEWSLRQLLAYHPFTRKSIQFCKEASVNIPARGRYKRHNLSEIHLESLMSMLLTVPTSVGGNVCIPLTSFIFRGFPDPASEGYSWIKLLASVDSDLKIYYQNWFTYLKNDTIEPDQLIQSPLSINHKKPPTPGVQSRDIIRDWILSGKYLSNQFIRNMKEINRTFERKLICKELLVTPMNPLIMHEIYNSFPQVYLDGILRRIENTRTIRKLTLDRSNREPIIKKLMDSEHNFIKYIWWRSNKKGTLMSKCATKQAREARNIGWGRDITGITTPHPLELFCGKKCEVSRHECPGGDNLYIQIRDHPCYAPYLGSKIKVKVHSNQDIEARLEPLVSSSARVARYLKWLNLGGNITNVLLAAIGMICDTSVYETFIDDDPAGQLYTGSVDHRFQPSTISEGCFINYAPQVGRCIFMSSDNMPTYGRGQTNYTLHFQALYCWSQYMYANVCHTTFAHVHLECNDCIVPVSDSCGDIEPHHVGIDRALDERIMPKIRETLGYITTKTEIHFSKKITISGVQTSLDNHSQYILYNSALWVLAYQVSRRLLNYIENPSDDLGLEDLQEYPRIYAYKIHRNLLINRVCTALIILKSMKINELPDGINLLSIKRKIYEHLGKLPLTAFKGIASLSLGRNDIISKQLRVLTPSVNSFPESVLEYIKSTRTTLIQSLDIFNNVNSYKIGTIVIPKASLGIFEHRAIIAHHAWSANGCTEMWNQSEADSEEVYKTCRHGCILNAIKKTPITEASLDKLMKCVQSKSRMLLKPPEQEETPILRIFDLKTTRAVNGCFLGKINDVIINKTDELVLSIPTKSIPKWHLLLSKIRLRQNVIVMGDGTGGTSLAVITNSPDSIVYPCALFEKGKCIPQDIESLRPALSREYYNVSPLISLHMPDDILHPKWSSCFQNEINTLGAEYVTVISDVESYQGNYTLQHKLLMSIPEGTHVILKLYAHEFENKIFCPMIKNLQVYNSYYTNHQYQEIIVMGIKDSSSLGVETKSLGYIREMIRTNWLFKPISVGAYNDMLIHSYPGVWRLCISESFTHVCNLGVIINSNIFMLKMFELIGYSSNYIKTRYCFGQNVSLSNKASITPERQEGLLRAVLIIITSCVSNNEHLKEFSRLRIQPVTDKRNNDKREPTIVFTKITQDILTKRDLRVLNCLRYWRKMSGLFIHCVEDSEKLLTEQLKFSEDHRTYSWALTSSSSFNQNY